MEEIVRKSRTDKYIASKKKIEIRETSFERPELTALITIEDGRPGHKRTPLQMLQKVKTVLSKLHQRRKKSEV